MAGIEINDFAAPDEVGTPERTIVEVVKMADGEIGRYTFQPGWRWSECIKPVVGTESVRSTTSATSCLGDCTSSTKAGRMAT